MRPVNTNSSAEAIPIKQPPSRAETGSNSAINHPPACSTQADPLSQLTGSMNVYKNRYGGNRPKGDQ
jgi:hypothetical protein